jgi:hypothetical protein
MYVIPSHTHSYEIVSRCEADLESWQRIIRTKATKARTHHKNSSSVPFLLPKNNGGAGIINIHNLHNKHLKPIRNLFHNKQNNSDLRRIICGTDVY